MEQFRAEPRRVAVVREVAHPTLVLGSTQSTELVSSNALRERSVELVRRRGGGGAVYLEPGSHLWVDAWVPRDDVLWAPDVAVAAEWVGRWWIEALRSPGRVDAAGSVAGASAGMSVHTGRSAPGPWGDLVCFAGRGPGEVFLESRKLVGLSQWRSREGALFSSCAYLEWEPRPLLDLLSLDDVTRRAMTDELRDMAVGVGAVSSGASALSAVRDQLISALPSIGVATGE